MEEFAKKVLDLPVLMQGMLGTFFFWLLYESAKILVAGFIGVLSKFNRRIKKELLAARIFHYAQLGTRTTKEIPKEFYYLVSLQLGVNRLVHALVYMCIGFIAQNFVGPFSAIPFAIAIGYLFLAMRAVHVDFGPAPPREGHSRQLDKLFKEWDSLNEPAQPPVRRER